MGEDNNPDRLLSEPPEFPDQQRERTGSMSLGAAPNANGDDVSPINGDSTTTVTLPPQVQADPNAKAVQAVINSEIGVSTLLNRLKQSIASAKVRNDQLALADQANINATGICSFSQKAICLGGGTFEWPQEALQSYSRERSKARASPWLIPTGIRGNHQYTRAHGR
jgi:hypothetical protein